jgi:hypothetical protein
MDRSITTNEQLTFGNCDMLQKKDNGSQRQVGGEGSKEFWVDSGRPDIFKASRDRSEELDRIFPVDNPIASVQPGSDGEYDNNKRVPQNGDEKQRSCYNGIIKRDGMNKIKTVLTVSGISTSEPVACESNCIEEYESNDAKRRV